MLIEIHHQQSAIKFTIHVKYITSKKLSRMKYSRIYKYSSIKDKFIIFPSLQLMTRLNQTQ